MDPTATFHAIKCALIDLKADLTNPNYRADAVQGLRGLATWLEKGGDAPDIHSDN